MVFSSVTFLFFFLPLVLLGYYLAPKPARDGWLLAASLFFYSWGEPLHIWVIVASILLNYASGLAVAKAGPRWRGGILAAAIVANLGLIVGFKYAGFLVSNLNTASSVLGWPPVTVPAIHLPLGISFITFHAISYVVDVFRGSIRAQPRLDRFALYFSLFPHLIAGPIVRYSVVEAEINGRRETLADFASGMRRFIVGLSKKVLVANPIGLVVDEQFGIPAGDLTTGIAWFSIVGYGLQIYFDFSAYSDMAIGLARMFGFHFLENFNYPYVSRSIQEFWRRWHISLSTWFRDYLYIPLGGNRRGRFRELGGLLLVFFLCGLWHGPSWNFVIWGFWHGLFLILERAGLKRRLDTLWRPLQHAYTLLIVTLGWVWFRTESLPHALAYFKCLAGFAGPASAYTLRYYLTPLTIAVLIAGILFSLPIVPWLARWIDAMTVRRGPWVRHSVDLARLAAVVVLLVVCAAHLAAQTYNPFIYFRF